MPEISDAQFQEYARYQNLGTPGDLQKKITDLEADNRKYRQEEKPSLEAKLPKDGEVVVTKEKADLLAAFEPLGLKPDEIKAALTERDQLKVKDAVRTREEAFRGALKTAGLDEEITPTLMALLPEAVKLEERSEKNDKGEDVKVPYVTLPGEGQQPLKLTELPEKDARFKGVRFEAAQGGDRQQEQRGQPFHRQTGGGAAAKKVDVATLIGQRDVRPSKKKSE